MAIAATTSWEVRTTGSDNNGGGFAGDASLAIPSAPTVVGSPTGGAVAANTYYIVVVYKGAQGEGQKSVQTSVTVTGATSSFTVTSPPASTTGLYGGATTWAWYSSTVSGGPYTLQSTDLVIGTNSARLTTPGGGVQPFGTDRSQQAGAQVVIDNATITTSIAGSIITFTGGYTPTAADVGNVVRMLTGTNVTAGFYPIISWTATTWTVSGAVALPTSGTTTNATGNMGGCLATPGQAFSGAVGSNVCHVKSGTYTMANSSNIAGGRITPPAGSNTYTAVWGYSTARGDQGTKPIFQPSAGSTVLVTATTALVRVENIEFQANSQASCNGVAGNSAGGLVRKCKFNGLNIGFTGTGFNNGQFVVECEFTGCDRSIAATGTITYVQGCYMGANTSTSTSNVGNIGAATLENCVVIGGNGTVQPALSAGGSNVLIKNCVVVAGTLGSGISSGSFLNWTVINTVVTNVASSVRYGFTGNAAMKGCSRLINCAGYNNTGGGNTDNTMISEGFISLSADPFVNAAGGDYTLNNTVGGGAALKAAGWLASLPGLSTVSYPDVGAYQSDGSASSGPTAIAFG